MVSRNPPGSPLSAMIARDQGRRSSNTFPSPKGKVVTMCRGSVGLMERLAHRTEQTRASPTRSFSQDDSRLMTVPHARNDYSLQPCYTPASTGIGDPPLVVRRVFYLAKESFESASIFSILPQSKVLSMSTRGSIPGQRAQKGSFCLFVEVFAVV